MQHIFLNVESKGIGVLLKLAERESLRMAVKLFHAVIELDINSDDTVKASNLKMALVTTNNKCQAEETSFFQY